MSAISYTGGGSGGGERGPQGSSLQVGKVYTYAKTISRAGESSTTGVGVGTQDPFRGIESAEVVVFRYEGYGKARLLGANNPLLRESVGQSQVQIDFSNYNTPAPEFQGFRRVLRNIPGVGFIALLVGGRRAYPISRELLSNKVRVRVERRHVRGQSHKQDTRDVVVTNRRKKS